MMEIYHTHAEKSGQSDLKVVKLDPQNSGLEKLIFARLFNFSSKIAAICEDRVYSQALHDEVRSGYNVLGRQFKSNYMLENWDCWIYDGENDERLVVRVDLKLFSESSFHVFVFYFPKNLIPLATRSVRNLKLVKN